MLRISMLVIAVGMEKYNGDRNVATVFAKADKKMYNNKRELKGVAKR